MENKCQNCIMYERNDIGTTRLSIRGTHAVCLSGENVADKLKTNCTSFSDKSLEGAEAAAEAARATDPRIIEKQHRNFLIFKGLLPAES